LPKCCTSLNRQQNACAAYRSADEATARILSVLRCSSGHTLFSLLALDIL
jgi:hypothetical protein